MIIREARQDELMLLMELGYQQWKKNRTFEQYCIDNLKEDAYGTRYVLEIENKIVSSLILLNINQINDILCLGIGSFLTHPDHRGNGYGLFLLNSCMKTEYTQNNVIFLYSDINPDFYEKLDFRKLPSRVQRYPHSPIMAYCNDKIWNVLINYNIDVFPEYF